MLQQIASVFALFLVMVPSHLAYGRTCNQLTYAISSQFGFGYPEKPGPTVKDLRAREDHDTKLILFAMARGTSSAASGTLLEQFDTPTGEIVPAISAPPGSHVIEVTMFKAGSNMAGIARGSQMMHVDLIDGQSGVRREIYIDARNLRDCKALYVQKSFGDPLNLNYEDFNVDPTEKFNANSSVCKKRTSAAHKNLKGKSVKPRTPDQILCDYLS